MTLAVLALAPHPDDEVLGAGATLLALRDAGHRVTVACVPPSAPERAEEVREACRRAGFALTFDDPGGVEADLLVAPSPADGHPAHEAVGRWARDAARARGVPLWLWGLWADLPLPTLYVPFDGERLAELRGVLSAHASQLARNDYLSLLDARGVCGRVLGSERVFGFGSGAALPREPYAEVLCEILPGDRLGAARVLDPGDPLAAAASPGPPVGAWLDAPSVRTKFGRS